MSYSGIIEYLQELAKHYFHSNRNEKSLLLNHACKITGKHRKSLIRILKAKGSIKNNKKNRCGAKVKYPEELLLPHIKYLWLSMERISSKRMKAAYPDWLPFYHENDFSFEVKELLLRMSVSTLARFIRKIKSFQSEDLKGLCSTSPAAYSSEIVQ